MSRKMSLVFQFRIDYCLKYDTGRKEKMLKDSPRMSKSTVVLIGLRRIFFARRC